MAMAFTLVGIGQANAALQEVTGWAWSSNIGWISFNCSNTDSCGTSNYKVFIEDAPGGTRGDFSGYAWSDNVGWISFEAADVAGCPSGTCLANVSFPGTGNVTGWAKVLSASSGDGFISMEGASYGVNMDTNTGIFSGFAWGDAVVGWVQFDTAFDPAACPACVGALPQCSDGADNDGDSIIDYQGGAGDPGCTSDADNDEKDPPSTLPQCSDTLDNDSDGATDYPADTGCVDALDDSEVSGTTIPPQCSDGDDNDGDGLTDFSADPGCVDGADDSEEDAPSGTPAVTSVSAGAGASATNCETITVRWDDNSNDEDGFVIQRRVGIASFSDIATVGAGTGGTQSYTDGPLLTGGATYDYRVYAYNTGGSSAYSNVESATAESCVGGGGLPADYSVISSGSLYATVFGTEDTTTNIVTITIDETGGFSEDIVISVDGNGFTVDYLTDTTIDNYATDYVQFRIEIPGDTAEGLYTIGVTGTSAGGTVRTVIDDIPMNISGFSPGWREI